MHYLMHHFARLLKPGLVGVQYLASVVGKCSPDKLNRQSGPCESHPSSTAFAQAIRSKGSHRVLHLEAGRHRDHRSCSKWDT